MKNCIITALAFWAVIGLNGCQEIETDLPRTETEAETGTEIADGEDADDESKNSDRPGEDDGDETGEEPGEEVVEDPSDSVEAPAGELFAIPEGQHYSKASSFRKMEIKTLKFRALFDSSAIYHTQFAENQGDINKLYGVSDCNSFHQINSARFGWRWYNDRLEILAYCYANGVRKFEFIDVVELNAYHEYSLSFEDEKYVFR